MFKKTLIAAAALSTLALGATTADAHGYGNSYGYGYGHHSEYTSYSYQPSCYTESRPLTIRVWDDYSCEYVFKTIDRDYNVCN
jgi:predicted GNAT superfamily acetyltransferase